MGAGCLGLESCFRHTRTRLATCSDFEFKSKWLESLTSGHGRGAMLTGTGLSLRSVQSAEGSREGWKVNENAPRVRFSLRRRRRPR